MFMIWYDVVAQIDLKIKQHVLDSITYTESIYVHGKCNVDIISGLYSGNSHLQSFNANTLLSNFIKCNFRIYVCVCPT